MICFKNKKPILSIFLLTILSILSNSCSENKESKKRLFTEKINELTVNLNDYDYVVIIPNEGCTGCISSASYFVLENIDTFKYPTLVVYTRIKDKKYFNLTLGKGLVGKNNVIIDNKNIFYENFLIEGYPMIIKLLNGNVQEILDFDISKLGYQ